MMTSLFILASTLHREAWRALLTNQPYLRVVGAASSLEELSTLIVSAQPTTILIDLPDVSPELLDHLKIMMPDCGILLLVSGYDVAQIVAFLQAGAMGCLSRDESVGDLMRAIIAAGRGEIILPPVIATRALTLLANTTRVLTALSRYQPVEGFLGEHLSEREAEILHLLGQGLTNKDIAQTLTVSVRTVEAHLRNLFDKLGCHSRTEAALWAVRHDY